MNHYNYQNLNIISFILSIPFYMVIVKRWVSSNNNKVFFGHSWCFL